MQSFVRLFCSCIFFLFLTETFPQGVRLPNIIKPSPEAAGMTRYALFPVNYSTGTPDISIPLYTVQVRDFKLPLGISYNASGVKVNDLASFVGLSWNLSGIGTISRAIIGRADDNPTKGVLSKGIRNAAEIDYQYCHDATQSGIETLERIDTEPDLFYYSFAGFSGKFYFGRTSSEIISVPYSDLKIFFENGIFRIVDTDGVSYYFSQTSTSLRKTGDNTPYDGDVTSWYLTRILLNNGIDEILFTYDSYSSGVMKSYNYSATVGIAPSFSCAFDENLDGVNESGCGIYYSPSSDRSVVRTDELYANVYIHDITFPGGKVEFHTENNRQDYGDRILSEVVVSTTNGAIQKYFQLKHSYFEASTSGYNVYATAQDKYRLRLDALIEVGSDQSPTHRFKYNPLSLPPRLNCGIDYWGYSNGAYDNKTLMSDLDGETPNNVYYASEGRNYILDATTPLANRQANENYMKAGLLSRIYYPTGGYTDFDFEPHQFMGERLMPNGGSALAIAKLSDLPNDPYRVKDFTPNANEIVLDLSIPLYDDIHKPYATLQDVTAGTEPVRYTTFPGESAHRVVTVPAISGHLYRIATSIQPNPDDPNEDPDLKTVSVNASWSSGMLSIPVVKKEGGLRIKSISNFDSDNTLLEKQSFKYGENEEGIGKLSFFPYLFNKRTYEQNYYYSFWNTEADPPRCVWATAKRLNISSEPLFSPSDIGGSKIFYTKVTTYSESLSGSNNGKTEYTFDFELDDKLDDAYPDPVLLASMSWKCGMPLSEKYFRNANNQFIAIREVKNDYQLFEKNSYHGLKIGEVMVSVPNGCDAAINAGTTFNYYAFEYPIISGVKKLVKTWDINFKPDGLTPDLVSSTSYFYDNLLHLQPTRIEALSSKGQVVKTLNKYPQDKSLIAGLDDSASDAIDNLINTNRIRKIIEKEIYIGSSLTERTRTIFKIWSPSIVAPKSVQFQKGSGTLEDRIQFYRYDLHGNVLEQSDANDFHFAYLWGYNYLYPVAEIKNASYQDVMDILGQAVVDDLNNNIPGTDDQVRQTLQLLRTHSNLKKAYVRTFTYELLNGITSATDINNITTYYKYDDLNRLILIKDHNLNILKAMKYHYKTQDE